jgi:hypothetical protein
MPDAPEPLRFYVPSLEAGEEWWDVILHFHSSPPASEETLRRVLLRALEDRTFAAHFRDEKAIEAFLPLPPPSKIKKAAPASGPIT